MEIKSYKKKDGSTAYAFEIYVGKQNGRSKFARKQGFKLNQMLERPFLNFKAS